MFCWNRIHENARDKSGSAWNEKKELDRLVVVPLGIEIVRDHARMRRRLVEAATATIQNKIRILHVML